MKKLLFILLMAVSATAFSQVIMYKIDRITAYDIGSDGEIAGERITHTKPVIITDVPNSLVTITYPNSNQVRFVLMMELGTERKKDYDGDYYNIVEFGAIDDTGRKCEISFYVYEEFTNIKFFVTYNNVMYVFDGVYVSTTK